jgi:putative DNA primase/helicase
MSEKGDAALAYAAQGLPVIPIVPGAKRPLTARGHKDAATDAATVRAWWDQWPDANVAFATGSRSGFDVLDIDPTNGGAASLKEIKQRIGSLPPTAVSKTPRGGAHFYFRHAEGVRSSAGQVAPGIDVRGENGYIIVPPSTTQDGDYHWRSGLEHEIAPWPEGLLAMVLEARTAARKNGRGGPIPDGQRNDELVRFAGRLRRQGFTSEDIEAKLLQFNEERCQPPLDAAKVRRMAESAATWPDGGDHLTDMGNAKRFVAMHEKNVRYVAGWGKYFVYDGLRWIPDSKERVRELGKETARSIYVEAAECSDDQQRQAIAKHARASESEARLSAMLAVARSEPAIALEPSQFDADPSRLNVLNGTLDLRTFDLRPHDRADLITKLAPVRYEPGLTHDVWERFIVTAVPNRETRRWLQKVAGASLPGEANDDLIVLIYGPGGTGKTSFKEAVVAALGDYAQVADFEAFAARRNNVGGPRPEIARLAGVRLVAVSEVELGQRFATGLIKQLAGGDRIATRKLYSDTFEFQPQATVWIMANLRPMADDRDTGLWRRIREVPFTHVIERPDPRIRKALRLPKVGAAVLAWMVEGLQMYREEGLADVPDEVEQATADYKRSQDPLADWLDECCVLDPYAFALAKDLIASYTNYCGENNATAVKGKAFAARLRDRGLEPTKDSGARAWSGIALIDGANGEFGEEEGGVL